MEDETLENENENENEFQILGEGDLAPEIVFHVLPTNNITFHGMVDGEPYQVGELNWDDGPMKFIGDAEESAKIFFDNIIRMVCTCDCQKCEDENDS